MAVPIDPTPTSLVTQALKRAGRTTPTSVQIQEALDHALQEVKADIMLVAATHPNLLATSTTVTTKGLQRYAIPGDANIHKDIMLLDGPDEWLGTAVAGTVSTITFAASLNVQQDDIIGKYVIITSGPGVEEYRQILTYNTSTRQATVDADWVVIPTSVSTYLIVQLHKQLWPLDTQTEFDKNWTPTSLGVPFEASIFGQEFLLSPVPDKSSYGLMNRYWVDLSKIDEDDPLFTQLLREWRSVWIQGVAVKCMQRFDEDRYQNELATYKFMLDALATQTCTVSQIRFMDV